MEKNFETLLSEENLENLKAVVRDEIPNQVIKLKIKKEVEKALKMKISKGEN